MQVIHTEDAPSHTGPVPRAVEAGGWIYVSALFGEHRPARSAIEAADFGRKGENARFMVEVVAFRG
jgi:hypothetical protein